MERAAQGCRAGEFDGVVTGPVSKEWLARIGYAFPGQTEFFAARWGGELGDGIRWRAHSAWLSPRGTCR
jgi:4-hydroxy-L-threonine phosphate dehydrogenase PdxA